MVRFGSVRFKAALDRLGSDRIGSVWIELNRSGLVVQSGNIGHEQSALNASPTK